MTMLPALKKSIPFCPLTSKSSQIYCFRLFSYVNGAESVKISLLIQTRQKQYYGIRTHILATVRSVKTSWRICFLQACSFSRHKTLTVGLEWCGLLWRFISCLDSHSDGTHSLHIHWWACNVMLNFSKSVLMKKQIHLRHGWPDGEDILSKY